MILHNKQEIGAGLATQFAEDSAKIKRERGNLVEKYSMTKWQLQSIKSSEGTSKHGVPCSCTGWTPMRLPWIEGVSGVEEGNECQGVYPASPH